MLTACTIVASNFLPSARVLAESFFLHHPQGRVTVLLIDDEDRRCSPDDDAVDWRRLSDLGLERNEIHRLAGIYDVTELATAVKPLLLRRLLDEGRGEVIYLDPDIRVYDALDDAAALARRHAIVLTPHTTAPYPRDDRQVDGFFILAAGVYNLGFIAVGDASRDFLDWWWRATRREALNDVTRMMFTDQRWIDFVPCFFDHVILKDPGFNVAYWNLHARKLAFAGGRYLVDGVPLRFFHFSGFDPQKPWLLSKHQGERPRVLLSEQPALQRICGEYLTRLQQAGFADYSDRPYGWSTLPSGLRMTRALRRLYWTGLAAAEQDQAPEPPDPFDEQHPDAFVEWLNAPREGGPRRLSRYLHSIYESRLDLQIHFRDIHGTDLPRYVDWIRSDGVVQMDIPASLLPPRAEPAPPREPRTLQPGINVAGYFRAEMGIGEAARLLTGAIDAAGIPYATTTYDATLNRQAHRFDERRNGGGEYDITVMCVNADSTRRFAADVGPEFFDRRHTVGYWFWEIEQFPAPMHASFDVVDEVWGATDFVAEAIRAAGRRPVFTVPLPVPVPRRSAAITRQSLGLPEPFLFLLLFDFLSIAERKNPIGLARAFCRSFEPGEGPALVLKSINGDRRLSDLERLRVEVAGRPDILVIDEYYSAEQKDALIGLCDCYVSLHRSEGLGLTMAEAMAAGKPVIATAYSGNLHFMTSENSYLVDYRTGSVPAGCEPYPAGARWAEPDLDHAASLMREVYERPEAAARRGRVGQADILERHSVRVSAAAVARRVDEIRGAARSRVAVSWPDEPASAAPPRDAPLPDEKDEFLPLDAFLTHLDKVATPRLSEDGRRFQRARRAAQRTLFRLLRPFLFQQQQFHTHLIGTLRAAVEGMRREERRRLDLRDTIAAIHPELDRLGNDHHRLGHQVETGLSGSNERVRRVEEDYRRLSQRLEVALDGANRKMQHALASKQELRRIEERVAGIETSAGTFQQNAAAHLLELTRVAGATEADLATLSDRLFAVPYMADPARFIEKDTSGRERLGYSAPGEPAPDGFYRAFEEIFRGAEESIRDRQRVYLPLLRHRERVFDLGCGRGEMLDVLSEAGVPAVGVDVDPDMVHRACEKGHHVQRMDALRFLREQSEATLPAIFTAQVIEHLDFGDLRDFLQLCRSRLESGGVLIAETVNPHALEAFKTFHTDLTHQRPIFPEVALALCRLAGFERAHVMFPLGTGDLTTDRRARGEYAVVATAGYREQARDD